MFGQLASGRRKAGHQQKRRVSLGIFIFSALAPFADMLLSWYFGEYNLDLI
jgi:hypothetical protein